MPFPLGYSNFFQPDLGVLSHKASPQNHDLSYLVDNNSNYCPSFEHSEFLTEYEAQLFNEISSSSFSASILQTQLTQDVTSAGSSASAISTGGIQVNNNRTYKRGIKKAMNYEGLVFAFKIPTNLENLDDGFKWRKYGKKTVKSNPNPRHYFKCPNEGCKVKKTVERDGDEPNCLLITYKGRHNHESPCITHQEATAFGLPTPATLQPLKHPVRSSSF